MALPANYTEVRHSLGMTGFFRRFIKNYAHIAKPLNDILEGEASKMKSEAVTLPPEVLEAFEQLKICCMTVPVLAFADFEKEFQLETDASSEGLGAVLSQKQPDGKWHPITFGSRELKGERPNTTLRSWSSWLSSGPLRNSSENTCSIDHSPCLWTITRLLAS